MLRLTSAAAGAAATFSRLNESIRATRKSERLLSQFRSASSSSSFRITRLFDRQITNCLLSKRQLSAINSSGGDQPNSNSANQGGINGNNNDDSNASDNPNDAIQSLPPADSPASSSPNNFSQLKSFIVPLKAGDRKQQEFLSQWKPPNHIPILPLIVAKGKPHFMPYNFIYTINDPHLIDLIRYRVMTNQNFVSIFLRRFDLSDSSEISNIEDLMPYGTFGEIKELKNNENSVSILVQGHAKIKLKSFINQSITDHINDFELSNLQQTAENSMAKKSSTKPSKKQQFQQLKANKRQLDQLKKAIIQREATKVANTDISSSDDAADQSAISTEKPRPTTLPLLVDTEYLEDQFESFSTQTQTPRIKALTAELVKSLSEIYFYNPLILEYIHLIYPQHQEMFESPSAICYFVAFQFNTVTPEEAYKVFACENLDDKLQFALDLAKKELEMRKIGQQINKEVEDKIKKHHRKFLLQEQLKEIKKQLGVVKDDKEAIEEKIRKKVQDFGNNIPPNISTIIDEELTKLSFLDSHSSEFSVTKNYLDWLTVLPWGKYDELTYDLKKTQEALDADHYGMEDLKRRIIEFVAISKLNRNSNGKILCFYGPPGVGKTSIGKSIASALNRKYFRFSVGGMGDVAEIKGHRRTYVGSMPGKIVQCLKKVQTMNPLVVIDEIDKIGRSSSHDGDCSSALLELLDPEQNSSFLDHYIDSSIDLSKILFICTANSLQTIPGPLKDRMELIEVNGYTPVEKEKIATIHLIPKISEECGIDNKEIKIDTSAVERLIEEYSRESGVRNLKKYIEKIFRRGAVKMIKSQQTECDDTNVESKCNQSVTSKNIIEYADRPNYQPDLFHGLKSPTLPVGTVTGLAYTGNGGSTLYIESIITKSPNAKNLEPDHSENSGSKQESQNDLSNRLFITGNVGKVMRESMTIASAFVGKFLHSQAPENYNESRYNSSTVHIHVPEGATPKDGPSAGIAITSSLISLAIGRGIASDFAMTGEISLNGNVLPVGGIREKLIAAKREKIKSVILPEGVRNQFDDIPKNVHDGLNIHFVSHYSQVYDLIFA